VRFTRTPRLPPTRTPANVRTFFSMEHIAKDQPSFWDRLTMSASIHSDLPELGMPVTIVNSPGTTCRVCVCGAKECNGTEVSARTSGVGVRKKTARQCPRRRCNARPRLHHPELTLYNESSTSHPVDTPWTSVFWSM
jgi:hypothetical protein